MCKIKSKYINYTKNVFFAILVFLCARLWTAIGKESWIIGNDDCFRFLHLCVLHHLRLSTTCNGSIAWRLLCCNNVCGMNGPENVDEQAHELRKSALDSVQLFYLCIHTGEYTMRGDVKVLYIPLEGGATWARYKNRWMRFLKPFSFHVWQ